MSRRALALTFGLILVAGAAAWALFAALPGPRAAEDSSARPAVQAVPESTGRKIKATLLYVGDDGMRLTGVEREIPFGEGTVQQARRLIEAELDQPAAPLASALPSGTKLRAIYMTERGVAFVDLSREAASANAGTIGELLGVYQIVDTLTMNLPAISAVQILVDGREVDTLAGHVDLRRPLRKDERWLVTAASGSPASPPSPGQ